MDGNKFYRDTSNSGMNQTSAKSPNSETTPTYAGVVPTPSPPTSFALKPCSATSPKDTSLSTPTQGPIITSSVRPKTPDLSNEYVNTFVDQPVPPSMAIQAPQNLPLSASFPVLSENMESYNSNFSSLFPGMSFNCYRQILPWVRRYSNTAYLFLKNHLPDDGPLVAKDLGYLLSTVVFVHDIKDLMLPSLIYNTVNGYGFLHFESSHTESVSKTIVKLLTFPGFVGASIDPMHMIDTAASVGATTIAANEASQAFRDILNAMVDVDTHLSRNEQEIIRQERRAVRFKQRRAVGNDHALMAAYREIIRIDFDHLINLKTTKLRTLMLGASDREYRMYSNNPHVFFQIANKEGKDTDRIVRQCLESLRKVKTKKLSKKLTDIASIERQREGVKDIDSMLKEWRESRKLPKRFLFFEDTQQLFGKNNNTCEFDQIIFQDVGYNFHKEDWGNIFRSTGALVGYGYMCLPWELLEPEIISPPGYLFRTKDKESFLAYHGHANGYCHETEAWATFMKNPILTFDDFSLGVEFVSRIGPMTLVKLYKTFTPEKVVRCLELPDFLKTVKILDIRKSFNRDNFKLKLEDLHYFAIRADEFHDAVNYGLDIAKESLNFNNILLFIRRRCSGISLVSKEISKSWTAPKGLLPQFALVVYFYVYHLSNDFAGFQDKHQGKFYSEFGRYLKKNFVWWLTKPIDAVHEIFKGRDIFDLLVKDIDHSFWQIKASEQKSTIDAKLVFTNTGDEDNLDDSLDYEDTDDEEEEECSFCVYLKDFTGDQVFSCARHKTEEFFHNFSLTNDELKTLKGKLSDTSKDPIGLKNIKEEALSKTPNTTFSNEVRVHYICGPPGTGKSHTIRAMATREDLVVGPFSRLKQDYTNFEHPLTGENCSLLFKTQHSAFATMNHSRIFVDEYTAMPYECLAVIVNNCAANEVFLVGDHRQVSLINEIEGITISSKINIEEIREHELIKNYRNPMDAVHLLNHMFNYRMLPTNEKKGFKFDETKNFSSYPEHTPLFFSHSTARSFGMDDETQNKVTVRANQGATFDKVKLVVTLLDINLITMPSMVIVALSRHREECVILTDDNEQVAAWLGNILSFDLDKQKIESPKISPVFFEDKYKNKVKNKNRNKSTNHTQNKDQTNNNNKSSKEQQKDLGCQHKIFDVQQENVANSSFSKTKCPTVNICLLECLSKLTNKSLVSVWKRMIASIGIENARLKYNIAFDNDDLCAYCVYNNIKIKFIVDNADFGVIYGNRGSFCGTIHFTPATTPGGIGHFYIIDNDPQNKIFTTDIEICNEDELKTPSEITTPSYSTDGGINWYNNNCFNSEEEEDIFEDSLENFEDETLSNSGGKDFNEEESRLRLELDEINKRHQQELARIENLKIKQQIISQKEKYLTMFDKGISNALEVSNFVDGFEHLFGTIEPVLIYATPLNKFTVSKELSARHFLHYCLRFKANISKNVLIHLCAETSDSRNNFLNDFVTGMLINYNSKDTSKDKKKVKKHFNSVRDKNIVKNIFEKNDKDKSKKDSKTKCIGGSTIQVNALHKINVVTVKETAPQPLMEVSEDFKSMARLYTDPIFLNKILIENKEVERDNYVRLEQSSFDAFKMLVEDFATIDEHNFVVTNQEALGFLNPKFDNGDFDLTTLDNLNQRFHPKKNVEKSWSLLNVAPGVTYYKNNLTQSLNCLQARYLTKAYSTAFNHESVKKAREIADLFFDEHMLENFDIFNEQDVFTTVQESEHAMKIKNYHKQTSFDVFGDCTVRFNMKDIFKPFKTKIDLFKAGQGISAWSKDTQTIFQTAFRIINKHFINCLKDHVVYDNGIDEHTLMLRVNSLFQLLPSTAINGVIDATACDSGQNRFTQMIERRILERLGISDDFLDWYYSQREHYVLKGYGVSAKVRDIKTSGEPATLLNNTILMACLMNFIIRGEGPAVLVIKGDDGLKRQANLKHREDIIPLLKKFLKMDFKIDIDVPITFCGYFLSNAVLLPDLIRKSFKVLGHRFRDYEHFTEYQQSLRDWVLTVNRLGLMDVCHITADAYELSVEYCYSLFHSIVSLTHISEKQFLKTFKLKEIDLNLDYPVSNPWSEKLPWYHGYN